MKGLKHSIQAQKKISTRQHACPIFQSTLTLPTIDFSSIDTNISELYPTAKLHEAVNLAVERIDFKLYSSHNKQKITDFLFHTNKQILIVLIIKDFIPGFDKSNQDQDHRQILDDHLKSFQTPPCPAVFNYCQATFGIEYAITHTDDIILQTFAPTFDSLLESYDPFQVVTFMEVTK
ncbi:8929_t:CDS:2 [Entrophospora sp. SA101]|nr:8929_t:CDS:2 [Entrophospora sp. SA101]